MNDLDKFTAAGQEVGSAWSRSPKWVIFLAGVVLGIVLGAAGLGLVFLAAQ